jgi:glycosyltransferase involved in cell wall biosynthesis
MQAGVTERPFLAEAPKLAVVITCWNYENYVGQAIDSITSQGRDDCELVVVDDGSTDSSWEVIQRSGVTAFRIENGGQRAACLFGFDRTRAPFVLFLDADDELKPGSLETIIARLDSGIAKLQFPLTRIDRDGNVISAAVPALEAFRCREELARHVLRNGVYPTPPTSGNVFRRDLCEILREADYERAVDGIILFAAPFVGDVLSLSEELGRYRIHDRNDSGLGQPLDSAPLRRDLQRFSARMEHLRAIAERLGRGRELRRPEDTNFHLERSFYLAIASGKRPTAQVFWRLLLRHWQEQPPSGAKVAMVGFFVLAMLLPNRRARQVLSYRLEAGRRTTFGLLQALMR